jgi:SAM-dependent methyltransferase
LNPGRWKTRRHRIPRQCQRPTPSTPHWTRYEAWFERHEAAYLSELLALRALVPWSGLGLEIGVGSGRFAAPLGIRVGVDPSPRMLALAPARGIAVVQGVAEVLPFAPASFDHALVATTICFVDSPAYMLAEAHRVLRPGGTLVIGFVDRQSPIGQDYLAHQAENVF